MKRTKVPDEFLRASELGQILLPIADRLKLLSSLKVAFEKCVVLSVETGKLLVDPFQLVAALKHTQQDATTGVPSAGKIYDSLRQWATTESSKSVAGFEQRIRAFCERQSYKLDGRYPFYVIDGFLPVRVHEAERNTEVGTYSVPSLLIDAIAPAIKELVTEERVRKFDVSQFIECLYQAYERCVLLHKASLGDPMPVHKIYQELIILQQSDRFLKSAQKSLFTEYTTAFFARDLARLMESSPCKTRAGKWFSDRPTSFPKEGLPILQNGQARIVGKLVFSTEQS